LCFQTRQQTTQVSIGWTANELMAFAKTVAYVYTTPPQREWQGLTDEEIKTTLEQAGMDTWFSYRHAARAIEAKLKEKNT
jgi:hypothetical protein